MEDILNLFYSWDKELLFQHNLLAKNQFVFFLMKFLSSNIIWPLFIIINLFLIIHYKKKNYHPLLNFSWKKTIIQTLIIFILSDGFSGNIIKPLTKRTRPCKNELIKNELVFYQKERCGGDFSFFSSHASNSMALSLMLNHLSPQIPILKVFIFSFTVSVSMSRIVLAKHYPSDVLVGWIWGLISFLMVIYLFPILKKIYLTKFKL